MNNEQKVQNTHVSQHSSNEMLSAAMSVKDANLLISDFMNVVEFVKYGFDKKGNSFLNYDTSWKSLMLVVEKIESQEIDLNISVVIKNNKCGIYRHKNTPYEILLFLRESKNKIEATWLAVVEFIKWHNGLSGSR